MTQDNPNEPHIVVMRSSSPNAIEWTAELLIDGGVVALPTDTVYGLAASLSHPAALDRIYTIKRRDRQRTLSVLVASTGALRHVAENITADMELFLAAIWPGGVTVIVNAKPGVPPHVTGPNNSIAVRLPNHPLAIEVIEKSGGVIACTSANRSGEPDATSAQQVAETLGDEVDLILDGGLAIQGVPSTVIDMTGGQVNVIREGAVNSSVIRDSWREVLAGA